MHERVRAGGSAGQEGSDWLWAQLGMRDPLALDPLVDVTSSGQLALPSLP